MKQCVVAHFSYMYILIWVPISDELHFSLGLKLNERFRAYFVYFFSQGSTLYEYICRIFAYVCRIYSRPNILVSEAFSKIGQLTISPCRNLHGLGD